VEYQVIDKRGENKAPAEVCRVCGSSEVHSGKYNDPTMGCIMHLRKQEKLLEIYKKHVNRIDDYIEYRYRLAKSIEDVKDSISEILSGLAEEIKKWKIA
jgi:hypothetical protein